MAHYIHDEKNNRIEGMSKEEIYALLADAIQQGQLPSVAEDTAFVTMIKSIVDGKSYKIGFCTQTQYNQLVAQGQLVADALYIITDDTTLEDLLINLENLIGSKVNQVYENDDVAQNINNNETGLLLTAQETQSRHSPIGMVKVNTNGVELKGTSYNHGEDDVNYETKLVITDTAIYVSRDLGEGATIYDLTKINTLISQLTPRDITITNGEVDTTIKGLYNITFTSRNGTVNCNAIVSIDTAPQGRTYYVPTGYDANLDATIIDVNNNKIRVEGGTITACRLLIAYSE